MMSCNGNFIWGVDNNGGYLGFNENTVVRESRIDTLRFFISSDMENSVNGYE